MRQMREKQVKVRYLGARNIKDIPSLTSSDDNETSLSPWPSFPPLPTPSEIVDQYYRIFRMASERGIGQLTRQIANLLHLDVDQLLDQTGSEQALGGILGQQYHDFVETAIGDNDVSRFVLVSAFRDFLFPSSSRQVCQDKYLGIVLGALSRVSETIITKGDHELWRKELNLFSTIPSVAELTNSLNTSLYELLRELARLRIPITGEQWKKWNMMTQGVHTRITSTNQRRLELGLSEIEAIIPASSQALQKQVSHIKEQIHALGVTTALFDTFFFVGVTALYQGNYGFIKELWQHVNPFDASVHWVNTNLLHLHLGFLTHQMIDFSWPFLQIQDHHGAEPYVYQYYLLCLAYALEKATSDWQPSIPYFTDALLCQGDDYSIALAEELNATYIFLINLPHRIDQVLAQYETVASVSDQWNNVFADSTLGALEKARNWLTDVKRRQEWESKANSIVLDLPLDDERLEAYKVSAVEYYESSNYINTLSAKGEKAEMPTELESPRQMHDKRDFTVLGTDEPENTGKRIGFCAVSEIVYMEIDYITSILLKQREIKHTRTKRLTFDKILRAIEEIRESGYGASVLLVPSQEYTETWRNDLDFRDHVVFENHQPYLEMSESTKLEILKIEGDYALVLDTNAGHWTVVNPLDVEIIESKERPSMVQIIARETVDYQVLHPEAVRILRFIRSRKQKQATAQT